MQKKGNKAVKTANKPFDFLLCIVVFILLALGIVMVLSASAPSALAETGRTYTYASRQLMFGILGIIFIIASAISSIYVKSLSHFP